MPVDDNLNLARRIYGAYESGDRGAIEQLVAEVYFGWDL